MELNRLIDSLTLSRYRAQFEKLRKQAIANTAYYVNIRKVSEAELYVRRKRKERLDAILGQIKTLRSRVARLGEAGTGLLQEIDNFLEKKEDPDRSAHLQGLMGFIQQRGQSSIPQESPLRNKEKPDKFNDPRDNLL